MSRAPPIAYVMLVAAAAIYGSIFTVNKIAAVAGVPPLAYAFWQSFGAGLILWAALSLRADRMGLTRKHLTGYLVIGGMGIGIPTSLLTYVAPQLPAALVTIVLAWSPPLTFLLSVVTRIEPFRLMGLLGLISGFIGVVIIIGPGLSAAPTNSWQWFVLALIAPLLFAASNVAAVLLRPPAASSASMGAGIMLGSSIILLPIMLIAGQSWVPSDLTASATLAVAAAIGINAAFVVLYFEIIRLAGPTFFSQFNYLAVLTGVAWGMLTFGERPSPYFFLAMLLMFLGVFLSMRRTAQPA